MGKKLLKHKKMQKHLVNILYKWVINLPVIFPMSLVCVAGGFKGLGVYGGGDYGECNKKDRYNIIQLGRKKLGP